ncbi:LPXTG cell wall anchor domain-containing protein [Streptomyces sp. NBC_00237]|uniref:LAETG motif-containing sortase-dependent surface protein n=1 Tax=Streptomyces sp. NBC_00237 TaxID=2975687 RepID=UPI00225A70AC|nr:LAETG motif-containing sortase-dependent surface protein [Streptomyces sp. NBC_00237]MCX5204751.1 LPXTG cell wall anchor domain-containing protein [Streptomyces sp. NBC_00237]
MKLRRSLALAAATAVIAPVSLLSATAAFADTPAPGSTPAATASPDPSKDGTKADDTAPSGEKKDEKPGDAVADKKDETKPGEKPDGKVPDKKDETKPDNQKDGDKDGKPGKPGATVTPSPSVPAKGEEEIDEDFDEDILCKDVKVDIRLSGVPGKIVAGSGWHTFDLSFVNTSGRDLTNVAFLAAVAKDATAEEPFTNKQIQLQAYNEDAKSWEAVTIEDLSAGYVGETDVFEDGAEVKVKLRLSVKQGAPAGSGFTFGGSMYFNEAEECLGLADNSYRFQIVKPGTDTGGTKPQEGGKTPLPSKKPSKPTTALPQLTGNLAETGSSSQLPMFALAGGAAVALGAGAMFVVRRKKAQA